jgi:hypothetical protein
MPSPNITVRDLATELGVRPSTIALRVTSLVDELGATQVIAGGEGIGGTVLTGDAADVIRELLADAATV